MRKLLRKKGYKIRLGKYSLGILGKAVGESLLMFSVF